MFAILTKNGVLSPILTFGTAPIFYMNGAPGFIFLFSQIICIYVTSLSDTKISSTEVTLMFLIMINNDVSDVMLTFEMTFFFLYD